MKELIKLSLAIATSVGLSTSAIAASNQIEEVVVTAQRTAESIQDVPIAVTALTGKMLLDKQVVTVSDLQMNAPNVSFTNTNFGSNSLSIRGIGRLLTAATGDAGVSVHTNEISIGPNLNSGEFYDMERVEILRGPQGTLYGKNATGGVVNFVTAKPNFDGVNGFLDVEVGDYNNQRVKAALNIPITDNFAVRVAGMMLQRDGYSENLGAGQVGLDGRVMDRDIFGNKLEKEVDGRDQTDFRITARWEISDEASLWVMYNEYDEDSNRTRINNQVCVTDSAVYGCEADGVGFEVPYESSKVSATLATLYGLLPIAADGTGEFNWARPDLDLRKMHTDFEPLFENNIKQWSFGFEYEFEQYTLGIVGGYSESEYMTQQDYNMDIGFELPFNFYRADGEWPISIANDNAQLGNPNDPCSVYTGKAGVVQGGPCQISGISQNYSYDQSSSEGDGWTFEVKLQSSYDGPFNFLVGYTQFDSESEGDYFVINNVLDNGRPDNYPGLFNSFGDYKGATFLEGSSFFGEIYYDLTENVKLTVGLRQNDDDKAVSGTSVLWDATDANFPLSTALAGNIAPQLWSRVTGFLNGAAAPTATELALINLYAPGADLAAAGLTAPQSAERLAIHSAVPIVAAFNETRVLTGSPDSFNYEETTGRIGIDWQINENSMLYAFFSRGYKPGGANPSIPAEFQGTSAFDFEQEDIDAFEVGIKNTLFDGSMTLNANIFTYDYEGLQVARIKNNSSINENIDAQITGAEVEMLWNATENLQVDFSYSWLDSEVDGGESVDPSNRTNGDPSWTALNGIARIIIAPTDALIAATPLLNTVGVAAGAVIPGAYYDNGIPQFVNNAILDAFGIPWQEGLAQSLDGNQLPNAPEHTIKLGLAYTMPTEVLGGNLTFRWDYYWQDDSYAREFNTKGDEIDSWDQHNAAVIYNSASGKWTARLWARNLQDEDNITGHYLTSDTSGYYRNYFTTEPRIYGLTARYNFGE